MKKFRLGLAIASVAMVMTWAIPSVGLAQEADPKTLISCCTTVTGKCEKRTKLDCQNMGGKEVKNCDECKKGK